MRAVNHSFACFTGLVALGACVLAACSSNSTMPGALQNTGAGAPPPGGSGTSGSGTGTGGDASVSGVDAGTFCSAPELLATGPCQVVKPSAAPMPIGGTVLGGTYTLTAVNVYGGGDASAGAPTCDIRYKLVISGTSIVLAYELGEQELLQDASGTFSTNGNVFTEVFTCQAFNGTGTTPTTAFAAYTAQGSELRLYGAPFTTSPTSLSLTTEYVFTQ
jgi:hypothetical protein